MSDPMSGRVQSPTVVLPRDVVEDVIDLIYSVQCQWGDEYLWTKFGHAEDAPRLLATLREAVDPPNEDEQMGAS